MTKRRAPSEGKAPELAALPRARRQSRVAPSGTAPWDRWPRSGAAQTPSHATDRAGRPSPLGAL